MMVGNGGAGSITQAYIGIYEDDNGNRGNLIATSTAVQEGWPQESGPVFSKREDLFNFSFPVNLLSGNFYWFVPTTSAYGLSIIYGSNDDVYPGGYWSGNPGADAYFYIR